MVTVTVRFDVFVTALTLHCEFNSDNLVVTRGGGGYQSVINWRLPNI
jgi:hypothetical protein